MSAGSKNRWSGGGSPPRRRRKRGTRKPWLGFSAPWAARKWLVRKFRAKTQSAREREAMAVGTAIQCAPPLENPRCEKCGNSGRILERIEGQRPRMTDQYCDCRMAKDLEGVERRKQAAAGPADGEEAQPAGRRDR